MPVASHNPATLALPSSAPVLEYICLFTHDLKRKQKRWQDGRLKYHTFNKRIMVYDDRGNFIGDMHWREDWEFGEGEEFNLERGAVIVQVSECVASVQQDLTELLEKRPRLRDRPS
ncbi:Protein ZGRF1 [Colletotrichum orbiculare MAFF 240422]|uniref:Protein ZGRF1 n=1 Tax=Colletotrichum orbiculare (strain 104-T / ATCC 96160 / CBS 514.97 / LARS 414 / MAFF 240422) TaxID=1213857 RepID=A0A484FC50_COLOR|nr:Protein ZGRF1 [Colletotrichum orbiculare MAFF 240422]